MTTNAVPAAARQARPPDEPERTVRWMYAWVFAVLILAGPWFGLDMIRSATGTDARGIAWSPDGRQLAVVTTDMADGSGAVLRSLTIGDNTVREDWARPLPSDWNGLRVVSWLPGDRRMLLSGRIDSGDFGAVLVAPGIAMPVAKDIYGFLATDGQRIVFVRANQIWMASIDGMNMRLIAAGRSVVAWSPDGTRVAFNSGDQIVVADAEGRNPVSLTRGRMYAESWSPDGRQIAFIRAAGLWTIGADGSNEQRLTTAACDNCARVMAWSPDGTRLAFWDRRNVYAINRDGSQLQHLFDTDLGTWSWSPDGLYMAMGRNDGLYTYDLSDGRQQRVAGADSFQGEVQWSPDGKLLAIRSRDRFSRSVDSVVLVYPDGSAHSTWSPLSLDRLWPGVATAMGWLLFLDLGLLVNVRATNLYIRRHALQAVFAAASIWTGILAIICYGYLTNSDITGVYTAWHVGMTLLVIVAGWWQVRHGDCWLMRLLGESGELPRPWATRTAAAAPVDAQPPQPPAALPLSVPSAVPADNWVAPIDPLSALQQGHEMLRQGQRAEAIICLNIALRGDPNVRKQAADELAKLGELERF